MASELIYDHQACQKILGRIADDFVASFLLTIPGELGKMNDCFAKEDFVALSKQVHHFKGSIVYTGSPALKKAIQSIEEELNKKKPTKASVGQSLKDLEETANQYTRAVHEHATS